MVVIINEEEFLQKIITALRPKTEALTVVSNNDAQPEWLLIADAKKVLPYSSKKKWRQLRETNQIEFSTHGRQFLYNRESLLRYIIRKSTLRATLNKRRNML